MHNSIRRTLMRNSLFRSIHNTALACALSGILTAPYAQAYTVKYTEQIRQNVLETRGALSLQDAAQNEQEILKRVQKQFMWASLLFTPSFTTIMNEVKPSWTNREFHELAHQVTAPTAHNSQLVIDATTANSAELVKTSSTPKNGSLNNAGGLVGIFADGMGDLSELERLALAEMLSQPLSPEHLAQVKARAQFIKKLCQDDELFAKYSELRSTLRDTGRLLKMFEESAYTKTPETLLYVPAMPAPIKKSGPLLQILSSISTFCFRVIPAVISGTTLARTASQTFNDKFSQYSMEKAVNLGIDLTMKRIKKGIDGSRDTFVNNLKALATTPETYRGGALGLLSVFSTPMNRKTVFDTKKIVNSASDHFTKKYSNVTGAQRDEIDQMIDGKTKNLEINPDKFREAKHVIAVYQLGGGFLAYLGITQTKLEWSAYKFLQDWLIGVANQVRAGGELYNLVATDAPELAQDPAIAPLRAFSNPGYTASSQARDVISTLRSSTFQGSASYLSLNGPIRAAYLRVREGKTGLSDGLRAASQLSVCIAIAQLIRAHADKSCNYCLVDFVQSDRPVLETEGLWNPFVGADKSVTNNIAMGDAHGMRGMVLTGPNKGGKSTYMKSLALNQIMAQTFGIAAARKMVCTPFAMIHCHMNLSDNTSSGESGHSIQTQRVKKLFMKLDKLAGAPALIVLDELYNSTSPAQANTMIYDTLSRLSKYRNCIFISPTHYPKATELEAARPGVVKNYQVEGIIIPPAHPGEKERVEYTFKIKPGKSSIENAEQVFEDSVVDMDDEDDNE